MMEQIREKCMALRAGLEEQLLQVMSTNVEEVGEDRGAEMLRQEAQIREEILRSEAPDRQTLAKAGLALTGAVSLWKEQKGIRDDSTLLQTFKFHTGQTAAELRHMQNSRWAEHRCKRGYELLKSKKQLDKALKSFKNALKLNPRSEDALIGAGMVYAQAKKLNSAREQFEAALELNPQNKSARAELEKVEASQKIRPSSSSTSKRKKRDQLASGDSSKRRRNKDGV